MPKKQKKKPLSKEEILKRKRENEKKRYERIKNDIVKLEALKAKKKQTYIKKKSESKVKMISQMTAREKRQKRKVWKQNSQKYRNKKRDAKLATEKFVRENTPSSMNEGSGPPTPQIQSPRINYMQEIDFQSPRQSPKQIDGQERSQFARRLRNKEIANKKDIIDDLRARLRKKSKQVHKLRTEKRELKKKLNTPNSKMTQMAEDPETRKEVVKKALFGDILREQIAENLPKLQTQKDKQIANKLLLGRIAKKRKIWKTNKSVITYKKVWYANKRQKNRVLSEKSSRVCLQLLVEQFLEDDKYSRLGAGKKETIKKNGVRKQKRYRLDTLKNLHKEFLKSDTVRISYAMFARLTPFWIVAPKVTDRDTCQCTTHSNFQEVVTALHKAKILTVPTYQNLLNDICCDRYNERCLERTCDDCSSKTVALAKEFDKEMPVKYFRWVTEKETFLDAKTNKNRTVVKSKKNVFEATARDLLEKLDTDLTELVKHERNIVHQYQTIKKLKESLTEKDVIIHMDFAENYATKYGTEIQSFHFGGSRTQIALHTVVVYLKNSTRSYCTVSSNLSHGVHAIWAHLEPVLEELPASVENIHYLSDGPVTQYRNKLMFYTLACKMSVMWPAFINWTWNYQEAGHGKGAPDGVGATCKRTADNVVAAGGDVSNLTQFCGAIQNRCPNVTLFTVTDTDIEKIENIISNGQPSLVAFKGTLQVHQLQGTAFQPKKAVMKSLSCFCEHTCEHYRLGTIDYTTRPIANVDNIYDDTDSEMNNFVAPSPVDKSLGIRNETADTPLSLLFNIDDPDGLLCTPSVEINPEDLFSVEDSPATANAKCQIPNNQTPNEQTPRKKRKDYVKLKLTDQINNAKSEKKTNNKMKGKAASRIKKPQRTTAKGKKILAPKDDKESDDCSCLVCGSLYKEDISGQDWIQCIKCHQWAQTSCIKIKTNVPLFTCPECVADSDYQ